MVYGIVCVLPVLWNILLDYVLPIPDQSCIVSSGRVISRSHHIVVIFVLHSGYCPSEKPYILADISIYFKPNLTKRKDQMKQ